MSRDKKTHVLADLLKDEGLADVSSATLESEGAEFLFIIDRDVQKIQEGLPEELESEYREGLCQYLEGDWEQAQEVLERILKTIWPGDGPSTALYRLMEEHSFTVPKEWSGYHVMDYDTIAKRSNLPPLIFESEEDLAEEEEKKSLALRNTAKRPGSRKTEQKTPSTDVALSKGVRPSVMKASSAESGDVDKLTEKFRPGDWR
jgi:hypothetical protein